MLHDAARFHLGGFRPAYNVDLDPEYPGGGIWAQPLYCFDRAGLVVSDPDSAWGPPFALKVRLQDDAGEWAGMFPSAGDWGITGVFACPSPFHMAVLMTGEAYLVDVRSPGSGATVVQHRVGQIIPFNDDLLLLVSYCDIAAIGADGVAWRSPRLALDDLVVNNVTKDRVACSGITFERDDSYIEVDTRTGEQTAGPTFPPPQESHGVGRRHVATSTRNRFLGRWRRRR